MLCLSWILDAATRARGFMMGHVVTLGAQLGELGEEPMPIFEEAILVDCVEIVPVLVCPVFIFLWGEKQKLGSHVYKSAYKIKPGHLL